MKLPGKLVILGLGVLTTLLMAGVWLSGFGGQLELWSLDWVFRQAPSKTIRDDLVHVDIDDRSIEQLGRWPWPRERMAGLIDTLKAAGAESTALDVVFPDPQAVRYVSSAQSVYGAFEKTLLEEPPLLVIDDAILSESIKNAGNVVLAMHMLRADEPALRYEPDIETYLPQNPETGFRQCAMDIANFDPQAGFTDKTKDLFQEAYLRVRARTALKPSTDYGVQASRGRVVAPLVTLAQQARDVAVVNADIDDDGKVRRTRLLFSDGEKTFAQFALSLALQTLQKAYKDPIRLETSETELLIYAGTELVRQIDLDQGSMLINWGLGTGQDSGEKHRRIGAQGVANLWQEKQRLEALAKTQSGLKVRWIALGIQMPDPETEELYWSFMDEVTRQDKLYTQRIGMERQDYFNRLYDPAQGSLAAEIDRVRGEEQQCETQLFQLVDRLFAVLSQNRDSFLGKPPEGSQGGNSEEVADYSQRAQQADEIEALLTQIPQDRIDLEENVTRLEDEMAQIVAGKICLIGSTATSAADFVPTPIGEDTPGINVHASIYDTIVSGELIRPAGFALNLTVILLAGLIVSLLSLRLKAAMGGPIVIGLAVLYALLNAHVILPRWNLHLAMAFPVGTMLCVFVVLTIYKELTEGRQKTFIKQAFKHYLSSHVIDQIMHDPQALQLGGEKRELTIMFTDLAGFSSFSERLEPVELTALLNDYLTEMTDIIMEEGGTL
ncbi:MAG: CHASE2 domain-containing protein, partial [Phycisphaeraceae bacterium]|nr:CHASE2 domain-containing protein [Phycisphaeraceae bacterium]